MEDAPGMIPELEPTMTTKTSLDSCDVHNELSPMLDTIEVLLGMCSEIELGISRPAARVDALLSVIVEKTAELRTCLDTLCRVKERD